MSESDAVFLGYKAKFREKISPNSNYFVVDSGKGTTDYSILKTNSDINSDIESKFRSGFVGAGNFISFAIFNTILYDISKSLNIDINQFVNKMFDKISISDLIRINTQIERIKRGKINLGDKKPTNDFSGLKIETIKLLDILDNINEVNDTAGFIDKSLDYICDTVFNDVGKFLPIDTKIILSGRAFKFNPFLKKFKLKFAKWKDIEFIEEFPKEICLLGTFSGNTNEGIAIEGIPEILNDDLLENTSNTKGINKPNRFLNFISNNISLNDENIDIKDFQKNFINNGIVLAKLNKYKSITCSQTSYDIPYGVMNIDYSTNNPICFFDGKNYQIYSNNEYYKLESSKNINAESFKYFSIFSMFPFVELDDLKNAIIQFNFYFESHKNEDNLFE